MEPEILRKSGGIQASYSVPGRINDTILYPRKSPNGNSIIVYGHSDGIRVIWYQGQRPPLASAELDASTQKTSRDKEQEQIDGHEQNSDRLTSDKYICGYRDVATGSPVLHLSAPPLPQRSRELADNLPSILDQHVLVATACAELSLRLITIPLDLEKQDEKEEAISVTIPCAGTHLDLISSISITWTNQQADVSESKGVRSRSRSKTREHTSSRENAPEAKTWSLLLASVSPSGSGLLLIHQVHLSQDNPDDSLSYSLLTRLSLRGPVERSKLSFNPSTYPSGKHSSLLLTFPTIGAVKTFDVVLANAYDKSRRGSNATTGSGISANTPHTKASIRYNITLYSPFAPLESVTSLPHRKTILDAAWVLKGRGILVLFDDGEWGVWDIEAAGPVQSGSSQKLLRDQENTAGVQGGAISRLAFKQKLDDFNSKRDISAENRTVGAKSSTLAPMTPHTRKAKSNGLFQGSELQTRQATSPSQSSGSIFIMPSSMSNISSNDDRIVLQYGNTNALLSSLLACWRSDITGKTSSGIPSQGRPVNLPAVRTGNEQQRSICLLSDSSVNPDFLATTTSHLFFHIKPSEDSTLSTDTNVPPRSLVLRPTNVDHALLRQGELDVEGIDRILDGMGDERYMITSQAQHGDDVDDMDLSTTSRFSKLGDLSKSGQRQNLFT